MDAKVNLGRFYLLCALVQVEPMKMLDGVKEANEVLGPILEHPDGEVRILAASWNFTMLSVQLSEWAQRCRKECLIQSIDSTDEEYKAICKDAVNKKYEELSATVISKKLRILTQGLQHFGQDHRVVKTLRLNLVHIYGFFEKYNLAKKHLEDLLVCEQQSLGKLDERRMQTMEMLAICQLRTGDRESAIEMMRTVSNLSRTALGRDDTRTSLRERHLQRLRSGEWEAMLHPSYRDDGVDDSGVATSQ